MLTWLTFNSLRASTFFIPLLALATSASANLISNGSFESVTPSLTTNEICTTDTAVYPYASCTAAGWTGNYQIGKGATVGIYGVSFGIPQPDPQGSNALILQSSGSIVDSSATQSIDIPADGTYTLTFYVANRSSPAGNNGPQTVSVLLGNKTIDTYSNLSGSWTLETLDFSALAGDTTLTFAGLDPSSGDVSAFIDDVSLVPESSIPASTAPEPSSLALIGLAFIGVAAPRFLRPKK